MPTDGQYSFVVHESGGDQLKPLVVFLHGIGERGDGTATGIKILEDFINNPDNNLLKGIDTGFTLIAPQLPLSKGEWSNDYVDAAIEYAVKNLRIKTDQITIMGVSLGGGGVWRYISASVANAKKFNVAVVICGVGGWSVLKNVADASLPVWAFHATDDSVVGVGNTISAVDTINSFNPPIKAVKTIYPTGNHYIWGTVWNKPELWQWMKQNTNINHTPMATSTPTAPAGSLVANAGIDQTITGTTAVLDGSKSTGYKDAWWLSESKDVTAANFTPTNWGIKVNLKDLKPGTHTFKLVISDGVNTSEARTKVTVQAGTATAPAPTKTLIATVKIYSDGSVEKV